MRDRVREFIGDSIIVGHNVLFDVAMFATHDIDLSDSTILDTFELSEILSQDVESLNLGFLAGRYGLSAGDKEHRALGDTRLSVGLFVHYMNMITGLSEKKQSILALAKRYEEKKNISMIAKLIGISSQSDYTLPSRDERAIERESKTSNTQYKKYNEATYSIDIGYEHEKAFLQEQI